MKKKILVLMIISLLVSTTLFAGILNLNIGATAQYKIPTIGGDLDGALNIEEWSFGPDIRLRLLFAEVGVAGLYSKLEDGGHSLSGVLTGGVSFDLLGFMRVGLGLGPRMGAKFDKDFKNPTVEIDGAAEEATFGEAFMNAPLTYRATVDFKLGRFLIGLNYTIDSDGFSFANTDAQKLLPDFENNPGRVGVSALFRLF